MEATFYNLLLQILVVPLGILRSL